MAPETSNPARDGVAAGLLDRHLLGGDDGSKHKPTQPKPQPLSAVDRARRELFLDAIAEGCGDAIDYAESAAQFVFMRDRAALFLAVDRLVEKVVLIGEATRDLRRVLGSGR
jgi:hypothetical protein